MTKSSPLTVATWNLHGAWNAEDQAGRAKLIHDSGVDLLCAQELTARRFRLLLEALGDDWWGVHSLSVRDGHPRCVALGGWPSSADTAASHLNGRSPT